MCETDIQMSHIVKIYLKIVSHSEESHNNSPNQHFLKLWSGTKHILLNIEVFISHQRPYSGNSLLP